MLQLVCFQKLYIVARPGEIKHTIQGDNRRNTDNKEKGEDASARFEKEAEQLART